MKIKTVRLDNETKAVLLRSRIDGISLHLPEQLDRPLYEKVAKAIKAAGGKWDRRSGAHIFPNPVRETFNIGADTVEVVNLQQTYQAFYTPPELAAKMAEAAELTAGDKVLEPSAGTGNLVRAAIACGVFRADITAVEIDGTKGLELNKLCGQVFCIDFMKLNNLGKFDRVLMNPPFTGGQDVDHITHAATMLVPGGRLVGICANGPKQNEVLKPHCKSWEVLPAGTFKESGTGVSAVMLVIEKE